MKLIKRLCLSVIGTVDTVVDRLQNHDALVVASLAELEQKLKEARSSYAALTRTLGKTEEAISLAQREYEQWRARACDRGALGDKESALECLRRSQLAQQTSAALEVQRKSSESARRKVEQAITEMQNMHKTLGLRYRELRVREQCQGLTSISPFTSVQEAEAMLHRWEDSLGEVEETLATDEFAAEFEIGEQRAALEQEFERLMKGA